MKTQNAKSIHYAENTFSVSKKQSKTFMEKFTEWFRDFLESSE